MDDQATWTRRPRHTRMLTMDSLRWVVRHRAWSWWYLVRYWRFFWLRVRHPQVETTGMVFLGRGVRFQVRRGYGRIVLGRWVHIGDHNRIMCHEGVLRIGDKVVLGRDNTVVCYLDVEIQDSALFSDWIYLCDFDHVTADITMPIKDQGLVKSPVRVGSGTWVGTKATILRGAFIGSGSVVAANAVVRGEHPDFAVLGGVPARRLKDRREVYDDLAVQRAALADIARKHERAAERAKSGMKDTGDATAGTGRQP